MAGSAETVSTEVLAALIERATVSTWIVDADETIVFTNGAGAELTGYAVDELIGRPVSMLMAPELGASHADHVRGFLDRSGASTIVGQVREFEILRKDGNRVAIELKAFELPGLRGGRRLFGAFISDNTAHKSVEAEMTRMARQDYLTGCLNRFGFMERAHQELSRATRTGEPLSLIVMDLDRFKHINDTLGHQGGDKVLSDLFPALKNALRMHDLFGRVGGEEFFVLLPGTDIDEAVVVAERLRKALEQHAFICNGTTVPVTASLGCASLRSDDDLDRLIQRADRRMYLAKKAGRNHVVAIDVVTARAQPRNDTSPASSTSRDPDGESKRSCHSA